MPDAYKDTGGNYHLSPRKKRDILVNNIYGVDIDRQAVEVTQMSLYLKVLEGENAETLNPQMTLALKEVYLPSLANNIKCGNSLIGTDFTSQGEMFDEEARHKVNPFDWELEFPEILGGGGKPSEGSPSETKKPSEGSHGFDVVIGNPPYRIIGKDDASTVLKDYLTNKYRSFYYKADLFHLFIEKGISLLTSNGFLGFITPNTWFTLQFTQKLRELVVENVKIDKLVVFNHKVFDDANVDAAIEILQKEFRKNRIGDNIVQIYNLQSSFKMDDLLLPPTFTIPQKIWINDELKRFEFRIDIRTSRIIEKIQGGSKSLNSILKASLGTQAYNSSKHTKVQIEKRVFHSKKKLGKDYLKELSGSDVGRYTIDWKRKEWIKYGPWLHDYRPMNWLSGPRILIREIIAKDFYRICGSYVEETYCNYKTILNVIYGEDKSASMKYYLAILNSRLLSWILPLVSNKIVKDSFPRMSVGDLKQLPIRTIDFSNPAEKKMHDDLVSLVEKMLELNKQLQKAHFDSEKEPIERQIAATDKKIDDLVYQLYRLTEEEIKIVEGKT